MILVRLTLLACYSLGAALILVYCHDRPRWEQDTPAWERRHPPPISAEACRALGGVPDTTFKGFCRTADQP